MRKIQYYIRLGFVLIVVALFYLTINILFHQDLQIPVLLTLLFITLFTERLWALLTWLSPILGTMDTKEQERLVEYELARSQRYGSHLAIASVHEKRRIPLHIVAQNLRTTDIVIRSSAGYLLVLLPNITLEQAAVPLKRLTTILPISDIVVADEKMLQSIVKVQRANLHGEARNIKTPELRKICIKALAKKSESIEADRNENDSPAIYNLLDLPQSPQSEKLPDRKIIV
jgi:hypothetical protein